MTIVPVVAFQFYSSDIIIRDYRTMTIVPSQSLYSFTVATQLLYSHYIVVVQLLYHSHCIVALQSYSHIIHTIYVIFNIVPLFCSYLVTFLSLFSPILSALSLYFAGNKREEKVCNSMGVRRPCTVWKAAKRPPSFEVSLCSTLV